MAAWAAVTVLLLCLHSSFVPARGADGDFGYIPGSPTGPENWGHLSEGWEACGEGQSQSPIFVDSGAAQEHGLLGPLQYVYSTPTPAILTLARSPEIAVEPSTWGSLTIDGVTYYPNAIHFHTPSEHVVNGIRYPLEAHFVHKTPDQSGIAVVGVLYKVGGKTDPFLEQIFKYLPHFQTDPQLSIHLPSFSVDDFPVSSASPYWRYGGSLTTPPCSEGVTWTVIKQIGTVSPAQFAEYVRTVPGENARPLQLLNGRAVYSYSTSYAV